jgi:anaerobic magnesium-protoporphyrin IX monomethyl ester cyclase
MQAVVVVPSLKDFYFTPHRFANLGAEVVLNILKQYKLKVTLINLPSAKKASSIPLARELNYLHPYLILQETGRLSFFKSYKLYGPNLQESARAIRDLDPDMVFISCFAFCYAEETLELAKEVKKLMPETTLVGGGAGVSAYPEYFLSRNTIDFCLTGEAEINLPGFLDIFIKGASTSGLRKLPNLYFPYKGKIHSPPLKLYSTAQDLDPVFKKSFETEKECFYSLSLGRGCNKRCRFCSLFLSHGRIFRTASLEKVRSKLKSMAPQLNKLEKKIRINFEDDNLLLKPDYFISVLKLFRKYIPKASFYAENGLDYTLLSKELLSSLIELGFSQFNLSLVSADCKVLRHERRTWQLKLYRELLSMIQRHKLNCITYFICGLASDSRLSIAKTLAFLAQLPTRVGISFFYPVPGIADFKDFSLFRSASPVLCKGSVAYPWHKSLSTETMITAFRLSRFINLLKSPQTVPEKVLVKHILREKKLYTCIKSKNGPKILPVTPLDTRLVSQFFKLLAQ